jgi:hypothetical protein
MNNAQRLWYEQAKSDLTIFKQLRKLGAQPCHLLHYLQMTTEKISKAYFWRSGKVPPKSHTGFVLFFLSSVTFSAQIKTWMVLVPVSDFRDWVTSKMGCHKHQRLRISSDESRTSASE